MMKNKVYNLRFRAVNRDTFEAIKKGRKKVETRAATERYQNIKVGDVLNFICGKFRFKKKAKKVRFFKTIASMLKKYRVKDINPDVGSEKELIKKYHSFPGYRQKIKKYGLVAIEL